MSHLLVTRDKPLVSCVLATRDRRPLVGQAIWYFLRQEYEPRELLVLDDGADPIQDLVPVDPRIRYIRLAQPVALGAKRNIATELANGDLLATWDDDDWYAPHRLSVQVARLQQTQAEVGFISDVLHYRLAEGQAWRPPESAQPFGGTLIYRRSAPPFLPTATNEYVSLLDEGRVVDCRGQACYVALAHPGAVGRRHFTEPDWQRLPLESVAGLLGPDAEFYVQLRTRRAIAQTRALPDSVRVVAPFLVYDGYGSMAEYIVLGLARAGARVNVAPLRIDPTGMSPEFRATLAASRPQPGEPTLCLAWWGDHLPHVTTPHLFLNAMWESSCIPSDWPARLNKAASVIAPTRFVADVFRACGVTAPLEVVPQGVDPSVYHLEERAPRAGLTTLMVGVFAPRKNVVEGVAAWKLAFANDPEARLIIKSRFGGPAYAPDDPRIQFVDTNETTRGIAHWYRQADVLMALGNEGFGLPLVEGMATGLPVIALDAEGQADICREARDLVLPVAPARWEAVSPPGWGDCGVRGVPGIDEIAQRLAWVRDHPHEARAMGRAASEWALRHRDVWAMGPAMLSVVERQVGPARCLRRHITLCCPEQASDGLLESAHRLAEASNGVRVQPAPTDLRASRLLHVQHEPESWDETRLGRLLQEAHYARVPVVVTQRVVDGQVRAWEREADVLVTHTSRGAELLRRRWPAKRVEVIGPGCPRWCQARRRSGRRVVALLGWPDHEGGAWHDLLELPRADKAIDMVVLTRVEPPELPPDACGVRVVVNRARVSSQDLADSADVVVLWQRAAPGESSSLEARTALASGVPVLASPASQFSDLAEALYQPSALVAGVRRLLDDQALRAELHARAREFCETHTWEHTARRHQTLWRSLECA